MALNMEKTLVSPLDCKEIQSVHPKGDQSCVFIGRTDVEAETPILWLPDAKSWLIWKDPDAGKDWGQEEKGTTEDEMVGWHHWLNEHGFGWTPGVGDGQGGLVCCGSRGGKELDMTEQLKWNELNWTERLERASLVAEMVKNLPAMQESQVRSLGWEDPLEEGMATHSSILAWRIHGQRSLAGYSPWGCRVRHGWSGSALVYSLCTYYTSICIYLYN